MKRFIAALLLSLSLLSPVHSADPLNLPSALDIIMLAGADFDLTVYRKFDATTYLDITGYQYAAQFRSAPAPGGVLFANYSAVISDPATGHLRVKLSRFQTVPLSGKSGVWDLRQTAPNGLVSYIISGKAYVRPTVTQ